MIEVKNVTKKYGSFTAVDDISFEVSDHEIVGFLGPNGAGKSTTMNMITGFIEPTKGKIIVNGHDVFKTPKKAKKQIGYMPEGVPLYYDLTVKEFVNYMAELKKIKKDKKAEVQKILEQTGLTEVKNKLIKNISRGYKQRVSLAGALIGNPEVLILDEPTVGLDPKQITEIRELIKELGKNHTVILSSHILSEVSQICERVIIINKGKILAVDTPENLEKNSQEKNTLVVTVEDKKNNMKTVKSKLNGIEKIELVKENNDGTKQYVITASKDTDIRKQIFEIFPKEEITIFELKKEESTLEDAFLKIINTQDAEIAEKENKIKSDKAQREEEIKNMSKEERKVAIKEDKKAKRISEKEEFDKEWEKEVERARAEKEAKRLKKEAKKLEKFNNTKKDSKNVESKEKENAPKKENESKNENEPKKENKQKIENKKEFVKIEKDNKESKKESKIKTEKNQNKEKSNKKGGKK